MWWQVKDYGFGLAHYVPTPNPTHLVAANSSTRAGGPDLKFREYVTPGEYEGGFKTWECTADLVRYVDTHRALITGRTVLDVGNPKALGARLHHV